MNSFVNIERQFIEIHLNIPSLYILGNEANEAYNLYEGIQDKAER